MISRLSSRARGISFVEVVVAMCIFSGVIGVTVVTARMFNNLSKQWALIQIQREAQLNLYNVTRDVRNSRDILFISSDTLILQAYNVRLGYDSASSPIFTTSRLGTITYKYTVAGNNTYLLRREEFDGSASDQKLLVNLLIPPDTTNFIFASYPDLATAPYDAVRVVFRLGAAFWSSNPRIYEAVSMKRSISG